MELYQIKNFMLQITPSSKKETYRMGKFCNLSDKPAYIKNSYNSTL